ncbi:hypothetical protein BDF14DRAFT_1802357 [Spinellus fusiger]|nr:hypothetical protein BDF14DRAFT_1802357 [Spinellus fusiger]
MIHTNFEFESDYICRRRRCGRLRGGVYQWVWTLRWPCWWALLLGLAAGSCLWVLLLGLAAGPCLWVLLLGLAAGTCCWDLSLVLY